MASDVLYSCVNDPNFTIICMFIDKFSDACGINKPSIRELCGMLEDTQEVAPALEELHIKLLRKIKKTVPTNRWENALAKFAYTYSNQDAWELERFGYKNSSTVVKLRILKALLEAQFDRNIKFKGLINGIAAEELRSEPIGKDKLGNTYWCILDQQCSMKIFCENLDDETWKVVASTRDEVVQLIENLKNNDFSITSSQEVIDEDTSSNSNLSHLDDNSSLSQQAKEKSLIIERRVYKKAEEIVHESKTNMFADINKPDNPHPVISVRKDLQDTKSDLKIESIAEREPTNDTVEEPTMIIRGEGSGAECESKPYFSEVIEEPTLFVYGIGDGVDNEMGNIKTGDDLKTDANNSKDETLTQPCKESDINKKGSACNLQKSGRTDKNDLPLKKKINKNYNPNDHEVTSITKSKIIDEANVDKTEVAAKSSEHGRKSAETDSISSKANQQEESKKDICSVDSKKKYYNDKSEEDCKKLPNAYTLGQKAENSNSNDLVLPEPESCSKSSVEEEIVSSSPVDSERSRSSSCGKLATSTEHRNNPSVSEDEAENNTSVHAPKPKQDKIQKMKTNSSVAVMSNQSEQKSSTLDDKSGKKNKRGRRSKAGIVDGLDISQVIIDKSENGSPPIRQSRRIAQQKIQEETNRRMIEEKMLRQMKAEAIKKKRETKQSKSDDDDEDYVLSDDEDSKHTESKVKVKKKSDKPWMNTSSESSSESEPEDDYIEHERSDVQSLKSDHEFSPESDLEDESIVPVKRARTVRVERRSDDDNESIDSNEDHACQKCGKSDHPEWILLCDSCDKGYHCSCLVPVLFIIPEGDWFCPLCQHEKLISNLQQKLLKYDEYFAKMKADEALQKQILDEQNALKRNCSEEPGLEIKKNNDKKSTKTSKIDGDDTSSSSSDSNTSKKHSDDSSSDDVPIYKLRKRNTTNLSYKLNEYDNLIKSAIDRSTIESPESPPHGKDMRNIVEAIRKEERKHTPSRSTSPVPEKNQIQKKTTLKKKKKKRLNSLDVSSEEDDGSDEDFSEEVTSSEDSFSMTEDSESSLELKRSRNFRAAANKRKDKAFINDEDDDSDRSGAYNIRKRSNKAKKILDDSDEFNDDDMTESEEIDSEDLCNDTETDSSEDDWKKRRTKVKVVNRVKSNEGSKKKPKKVNDDVTYKSGIRKRPAQIGSDSDSSSREKNSEEQNKRRTRGKKLHYILDDDFESSDDGITPGVHRPDTPPEEREKFIKKQEEIKRMLAEKNTAAAKQLATPMMEPLEINEKNKQTALSVIPLQVIESAKVLDIDFLKSSKHLDSDDFDEELAANLPDPDVNEEELAKIMEEEDFAQHQLKLDDPEIENNTSVNETPTKKKIRHFESIDPTKITKPDKKIGSLPVERKVDAVCSNLVNYLQSKSIPPPPSVDGSPIDKPLITNPHYHSMMSSSTGSSSLLQQMKQQAIPLQDDPSLPTSLLLNSKQPYPSPLPLLPPIVLPISNSLLPTPPIESKACPDIRRRRRKKITPLRGDLYKQMDGRSPIDVAKQLHYLSPAPPNVTPTDKGFAYGAQKPTSTTIPPTYLAGSTKITDGSERFPNPCTYILPPDYGFCNTTSSSSTSIVPQPETSTLEEHHHRSFESLEPVNTEEPLPEQTTGIVGHTENPNETESTSEFSGLVSYFSSQQNELNA